MNQYLTPTTETLLIDVPSAFAASGNTESIDSKDGIWDAASPGGDTQLNF